MSPHPADVCLPALARLGFDPASLDVCVLGGLEGGAVALDVRRVAADGSPAATQFVLKRLTGAACRELGVYRWLAATGNAGLAPHLVDCGTSADETWLLLERLRPLSVWPWSDLRHVARVVDSLAALHMTPGAAIFPALVAPSPYERDLPAQAAETVSVLERAWRDSRLESRRALRRAVRRVAGAVDAIPAMLASAMAGGVLHGDVHSENVMLTSEGSVRLIDWARARVGSPLEDVASWLQSLVTWEPEVRRHHDTFLRRYLSARGLSGSLTADLRDAYWLAAARNAFAGALRYQIFVMQDPAQSGWHQARAAHAVDDWLRIVRRADAALSR